MNRILKIVSVVLACTLVVSLCVCFTSAGLLRETGVTQEESVDVSGENSAEEPITTSTTNGKPTPTYFEEQTIFDYTPDGPVTKEEKAYACLQDVAGYYNSFCMYSINGYGGPINPEEGDYYEITISGYIEDGSIDYDMWHNSKYVLESGMDDDTIGSILVYTESNYYFEFWFDEGDKLPIGNDFVEVKARCYEEIPAMIENNYYITVIGGYGNVVWDHIKFTKMKARFGTPPSTTTTEKTEKPTTTVAPTTEPTSAPDVSSSDILAGDANDDGGLDMKDVLMMRRYIAGLDAKINLDNADFNGDGSIDMKDVLGLRKKLANIA